jgi:hypothetical protein
MEEAMLSPRNPIVLGVVLLTLFGASSNSLAQSVPVIFVNDEGFGVTISSPRAAKLSPELISDLGCTLTNRTSKPIVSYVVLWTLWTASGGHSNETITADAPPIKSRVIIQPGQSAETDHEIESSATAPTANQFVRVEVSIDFVLFGDGSKAGRDIMKVGEQITYGKLTANSFRGQLLQLYQEKGLDALLQELNQPIVLALH